MSASAAACPSGRTRRSAAPSARARAAARRCRSTRPRRARPSRPGRASASSTVVSAPIPGRVQQRVAALELAEPRLGRGAGRVRVARVVEVARLARRRRTARSSSGRRDPSGEPVTLRAWPTPRSASTRRRPRSSRGSRSGAPGALHAGSEEAVAKRREAGKLLARERAEQLCDPGTFVELDRYVRHREPSSGCTSGAPPATRSSPATARCSAGACSSSARTSPSSAARSRRSSPRRSARCSTSPAKFGCPVIGINDSGGARIQEGVVSLAGLCGDLLAQRAALGRRAAALARDGPVRGRRRLLARDDRLRAHGRGLVVHVHHRPRRGEDRDGRGGHPRGARRRRRARDEVRRRAPDRGRRRGAARGRALPALLPAAEQPPARRRTTSRPTRSTARRPSSTS